MKKEFKTIKYQNKGLSWETFPEICKSCGLCLERCPVKCLSFDEQKLNYLGLPIVACDIEKCIACHTCEKTCPDAAIRVDGKK